ncbi:ABC transporter permease [Streptomyces radicis]|uniref:ABC transporter permease n=1 Tax=Streptomyces radicis TaxID=1750517 RepID=A0A3A9WJN3_9ACTN|nr:ABC transporter permease [Streptomyces radicis]RKN12812.1 ABC transporter permease [Streptomyces radicis]RKN27423.1 ABC transporter permease [Streptomyces radicis]
MSRTTFVNRVLPWILPLTLLGLWEYFGRVGDSIYLPPLSEVLTAMREDWLFDHAQSDLLPSLRRFAVGYLAGSVLGILLGMAIASSRRVAQYTGPTLEFLRALPAVAVLPVAVLIFGLGDGMRISIIAFGVLFPVLVNTATGARNTRQERIDVARMYGLSRFEIVRRVIFPSAIPMISAGLRVGLPIALIMMVVSELVGGQNGIGFYLTTTQSIFDISGMFTALIILGLLGNIINAVYTRLETRSLHWASQL